MTIKSPTHVERLADKSIKGTSVTIQYDHNTDNYEILVANVAVWGSNGSNNHEFAESTFDAIVDTVRVMS